MQAKHTATQQASRGRGRRLQQRLRQPAILGASQRSVDELAMQELQATRLMAVKSAVQVGQRQGRQGLRHSTTPLVEGRPIRKPVWEQPVPEKRREGEEKARAVRSDALLWGGELTSSSAARRAWEAW